MEYKDKKARAIAGKALKETVETTAQMASIAKKSSSVNTRLGSVEGRKTNLYGIQGNGSAYAYIDISLNGNYDLEFKVKAATTGATIRLMDFRYLGGIGYANIASTGLANISGGTADIDNNGASVVMSDSELHTVVVTDINIVSTRAYFLTVTSLTEKSSAFLSEVRIFDRTTDQMLYEFLFDDITGDVLYDSANGVHGVVVNNYAGFWGSIDSKGLIETTREKAINVSKYAETPCLLIFDDGLENAIEYVAPTLSIYGMTGNAAILKNFIGINGYMTLAQISELSNTYGWGIVNHTETGADISVLALTDEQAAYDEVKNNLDYLNSLGYDGDMFVYSGSNSYSPLAEKIAREAGAKMARIPSINRIQGMPILNPMKITPLAGSVINEYNFKDVRKNVSKAVAEGCLVCSYWHAIDTPETQTWFENFLELLQYYNVKTYTMKDFYNTYVL